MDMCPNLETEEEMLYTGYCWTLNHSAWRLRRQMKMVLTIH